jgi:DNA-binding transcriptional MerR regulator
MNTTQPIGALADPHIELDLEALVAAVDPLWARLPPPADARTSAQLDARTVRYYQTVGVLPKPLRYDGRRALYGHDHLVRLVCVRALQAQGHSLAQVQRALAMSTEPMRLAAAAEALSLAPPDLGATPTESTPRALLAFELAPGVQLLIDPRQVNRPDAMVALLAAALRTHPKELP